MKKLLLVLAFALPVFGLQSKKIDASSTNIPTEYSASDAGSRIMTGVWGMKTVCCYNGTASVASFSLGTVAAAPTAVENRNAYMPASTGVCVKEIMPGSVYLRSDSGSAISSGKVYCWVSTD